MLGRVGARLIQAKLYERVGFARVSDYARERLGISARELHATVAAARALDALPALAGAFACGELSWSQVRLLAAVADAESDARWVALARGRTVRQLDAIIRSWRAGGSGGGDDRAAAEALEDDDGALEGESAACFRLLCPARLRARWRTVVELARKMAGAPLSWWRAAEAIAAEGLSGAPRDRVERVTDPAAAVRAHFAVHDRWAEHAKQAAHAGAHDPSAPADRFACVETPPGFDVLDWSALEAMTPEHVARLGCGVADVDAFEIDRRLREVLDVMQRLDWQLGRLLRLFVDLRLPPLLGFDSAAQYIRERLGISTEKARVLVTLERATWRSPALMDAYSGGRISWTRALTIVPILSESAGGAWVARAGEVTVRRLADEVEWALTMRDLTPLWIPVPPPSGAALVVPETQMCARRAAEGIDAEITFRGPRSVVTLLREAIAAFAEPGDLPWRACERLLDHVEAEWKAQPRHRDPIFARDGWRCAVPACSGRRNLQDHHIVFRSRGGDDERINRVTVCVAHHLRGIHTFSVRASGRAPDAIRWDLGLRRDGPPLLRLVGDRYVRPERIV